MNKEKHRHTALPLLLLSVKELFPKVKLRGGKVTARGFFYDFFFPFSFHTDFLRQIEERMFFSIKNKEKIFLKEMVPYSACEYFLAQKEYELADELSHQLVPILSLAEIGGKMFLSEATDLPSDVGALGSVKLFQYENFEIEEGKITTRLYGEVFSSKEEAKEFTKNKKKIGASHQEIGRKKKLFIGGENGHSFFLPKGEKIKEKLEAEFRKLIETEGGFFVSTLPFVETFNLKAFSLSHQSALLETQERFLLSENFLSILNPPRNSELNLLNNGFFKGNISHLFCKKNIPSKEVISSLHFVTKIFKLLELEYKIVLIRNRKLSLGVEALRKSLQELSWEFSEELGSVGDRLRIEWRVQDRLGLEWAVSCVYAPEKTGKEDWHCLPISFFFSLERLIALMLEKQEGEGPAWLFL